MKYNYVEPQGAAKKIEVRHSPAKDFFDERVGIKRL